MREDIVSAGLTTAGRERLHAVAERYVGDGQDPDRYQVPGLVGLVACGGSSVLRGNGQCVSRLSAEERQHGEHTTMLVG